MNVNVWDVVDDLKAIVAAERPVDPDRLADPSFAFGEVVGTGGVH
jgi:3-phenylpropionate/trans-cinnamate dioxygenase ferredoxin reductase subunit